MQEMREQFATMLEDARLVNPRKSKEQLEGQPYMHWLDDKGAQWNCHTRNAAVVRVKSLPCLVGT